MTGTVVIGKWHLVACSSLHPNNRGFDYFYGFLSGGHCYFHNDVNSTHTLFTKDGSPHYAANEGSYLPLIRNNKSAEFDEYLTSALSKDAVSFIKGSKDFFCLYLSYNAPHTPLEAPKESINKYAHIKDWNRRVYAAMIH